MTQESRAGRTDQVTVAMLASVLRSERAVQVNIAIMRAFVQLRQVLDSHEERLMLTNVRAAWPAPWQSF